MVKRSLDAGLPAGVPKRQRQCWDEDSTQLKAARQTDHAALRRVQEFLCAAGISCTPGVLRDATNGQILAQVPAQAWYGCAVSGGPVHETLALAPNTCAYGDRTIIGPFAASPMLLLI